VVSASEQELREELERVQLSRPSLLARAGRLAEEDEGEGIHLSFTDLMALLLVFFVFFFSLNKPFPLPGEAPSPVHRLSFKLEPGLLESAEAEKTKASLIKRLVSAAPAWADGLVSNELKLRQRALDQIGRSLLLADQTAPTGADGLVDNELELNQRAVDQIAQKLLLADQATPAVGLESGREKALENLFSDSSSPQIPLETPEISPEDQPESQVDRLLAELETFKKAWPQMELSVQRQDNSVILTIGDRVTFEEGRADIKPAFRQMLARLAETLKQGLSLARIRIKGHTDSKPIHNDIYPSNWELSGARAARVARFLIDKGLNPRLIEIAGYSEYQPVAPNSTKGQRAQNRRVEIELSTTG